MSRHRYYQNAEENYSDEEDYSYSSSYGTSYGDDGNLSTSVENQYMYKRGQSGTTPKMESFLVSQVSGGAGLGEGEFEMDLEVGGAAISVSDAVAFEMDLETKLEEPNPPQTCSTNSLKRKDSGVDLTHLTVEQIDKMNSVIDYIQDIVGDTVPENTLKETIIAQNFDAEKALNCLLNRTRMTRNPDPAAALSSGLTNRQPIKLTGGAASARTPVISIKASAAPSVVGFAAPVSAGGGGKGVAGGGTQEARVGGGLVARSKEGNKRSRSNSPMPGAAAAHPPKLEHLSLQDSGTPGSSPPGATPLMKLLTDTPTSTPYKQVVMRKEKLDGLNEFNKDRGSGKEVLNLVVIGHVDSGKSTLMGHLLFKLGSVSQKIMHKYEKESKKIGKQSFMYAWVLDETDEERNRGITMDVGHNKFETDHRIITLLDAPGHRDFIPNMISGAYQADVAVMVVNATRGEFEAGFEAGGQTREHALLVRSLGVSQLVIAVNKLDTVDWSQERFNEVRDKLKPFLTKQAGFRDKDLVFVPCSGLTGDNLTTSPESTCKLSSWYKEAPTLIQAIDNFRIPERAVEKPFRMSISDVFKGQSSGLSVTGRVEAGFVMKDDKIMCSPLNQICAVKNVLVEQMASQIGFAGDHVTLVLNAPDQFPLTSGMVLCDPSSPIQVTDNFRARIVVFNLDVPITKGFQVVLHYGCVTEQASVKKLISLLNKSTGEVVKSKPRSLTGNCSAVVDISVSKPLPLELYKNNRELGRFMLRTGGHTIAAGMITELL